MDPNVINLAWKYSGTFANKKKSKWVLKKILENYIPKELIHRPKKGFSVPLNNWLRGPLKNWMLELLNKRNLSSENFFDENLIKFMIKKHLNNEINFGNELWSICIFQQWRKYYNV
jgi:asparagine synthase (glutamine-hydrolysing)